MVEEAWSSFLCTFSRSPPNCPNWVLTAPSSCHTSLERFSTAVADSGEGRWTLEAAVDEGVPVPVLAAALFARFESRGGADFANRLLSAMRDQFGGHGQGPQGK